SGDSGERASCAAAKDQRLQAEIELIRNQCTYLHVFSPCVVIEDSKSRSPRVAAVPVDAPPRRIDVDWNLGHFQSREIRAEAADDEWHQLRRRGLIRIGSDRCERHLDHADYRARRQSAAGEL